MTAPRLLALVWIAAAAVMTLGWRWQQRRRNAGIVDVLWAGCLGASAVFNALLGHGATLPRVMLGLGGGLWGLRLAWHLGRRVATEPEDGRYRHLRGLWGDAGGRWLALFQLQAALVALFSVPFVIGAGNPRTQPAVLALAALLWATGLGGEWLADRQLARFRTDPANRGRTCRYGLWRWSRHPNYFFEWLHWFSYAALASGAPQAAWAWTGPAAMYVFLRYLSGIPFTEAQALRSRGADYRDYQQRTSALVPWPPRRPR